MCGPVGCYFIRLLDVQDRYKELFCKLFRLLQIAKSKSSTAGLRAQLEMDIPNVMTELEICMPVDWNTPVAHFFVCTTVETILDCGNLNVYAHLRSCAYVWRTCSYV